MMAVLRQHIAMAHAGPHAHEYFTHTMCEALPHAFVFLHKEGGLLSHHHDVSGTADSAAMSTSCVAAAGAWSLEHMWATR